MEDNKRAHPRVNLVLQVSFPDQPSFQRAWTENLSMGGTFVVTDHPLTVGAPLVLELSFPGLLEPVRVSGQVVRTVPRSEKGQAGVGVRFDSGPGPGLAQALKLATDNALKSGARTFRILVVDDNEFVQRMYARAVRQVHERGGPKVEVEVLADGRAAASRLQEDPPVHLVMSDVYMPVMDGFALVEFIRKSPHLMHLPVIVISTGGQDTEDRLRALGIQAFMKKPVQLVAIVNTVRALLRSTKPT